MSTPSTLPPHHPNYGYSHHQNYQSNSGYRASNTLLNGASRLGAPYHFPTPSSNGTSSASVGLPDPSRASQNVALSSKPETKPAAMPTSSASLASKPNPKKRQRSREPREPDWHKFYKNGLPKEVIVIDDSPTPDPSASVISNTQPARPVTVGSNRHAAKKRKRDDVGSVYDPVYHLGPSHSNDQSPEYKDSSGSTISTDRTTSAIHTTAATSLGSHSSNGQNGYEATDVQPGQKRKRTATRLQIANEAKRKEQETNGDAYSNYHPPPKPPIKAPDVQVKQVADTSYTKNSKVDDDDGHYIVVPDADLTERYQVTKLLGQGTFGKVVQARDRRRNKQVAIKIIRSVQKYRDASRIELRVLSTLKANDHENRNRCIHLRDCFDYRGHICIVMDLLGQSVFDFLKGNSFVPFPNSQIQTFARQLFTSVAFLHDLNLIHTDLKPENILLCDSSYQAFTYSRRIPSSSTTVNRQAAQRKVLLSTEIRLIDFGSATFQDEYHSSVVSTRHYRAPEIILGLGWSFPCDIWSIGCILVEFFTGDALFQTHDNLEHLAMMEAVCGKRLDSHLIQQVNTMAKRSSGNPAAKFFKRLKLDYPQPETSRASRRFVKAMKRLEEIIPDNNKFCRNFLDLLRKIFIYDPADRITAKEALQHVWFKEGCAPDDGTEAMKIKAQRAEAAEAAALAAATRVSSPRTNGVDSRTCFTQSIIVVKESWDFTSIDTYASLEAARNKVENDTGLFTHVQNFMSRQNLGIVNIHETVSFSFKKYMLCIRSQLRYASQYSVRRTIDDSLLLLQLPKPSSSRASHSFSIIPGYSSLNVLETEKYILFGSKKVKTIHEQDKLLRPILQGYNKMKCWVEFLCTPTADTPGTTLLLHFDNKRYLIGNIAEGTQRAAVQRKLGLLKVRDIFLTGTIGWNTAGGLMGMILTLADGLTTSMEEREKRKSGVGNMKRRSLEGESSSGKERLGIHGGKNITQLLATARRFIFRHGMPLTTNEFKISNSRCEDTSPTWEDENIKVWAMIVVPEGHVGKPRKRSHDEFANSTSSGNTQEIQAEQDGQYDEMLKSVVSAMFDSNWRLDTLVKQKLSQVQLPSTIFVRDSEGKIQKYEGPTNSDDPAFNDIEVLIRNPWPGALIETLPPTTPSTSSTCYIIKNHPQRGKFDPQKAIDLGVPKGKDFSRLTKGETLHLPNGTVVTPDMVLGKGKEGGGFAIVELPTLAHVKPLLSREEWSLEEIMVGVEAVVWILGPGVSSDDALQKFMADRTDLNHIVSSVDCCPDYLALESAASAALRLNCLDPTSYPIPWFNNENSFEGKALAGFEKARTGQRLLLEPRVEIQNNGIIPYLDTLAVMKETPKDVLELAAIARTKVTTQEYQAKLDKYEADIPCRDAEIITLGTGSALPSKYRNVSATLLRIPEYGNFLFDCGENTLGQLKRVFGAELPGVLRNLKGIWISHLHADHHLGTASVIRAWSEETKIHDTTNNSRLFVASDSGMTDWLQEYAEVEDYGYNRVQPIILDSNSGYEYCPRSEQVQELGLVSIRACPVHHCRGALAVVFKFVNGFKVAYSGDCRPSDKFVQIGQDATLLIHEATFDDELQGDAKAKKHSTTAEALDVGKRMNARRILLTHFSQRYQKIPVMNSDEGKDQVAVVAFDYMKLKLGNFAKMEAFRPALMKLYEEPED